MRKKDELPAKPCAACGKPFFWRRKWARDWKNVKTCSDRCRTALKRKMTTLRIVLGDQLTRGISSLRGLKLGDAVLMMEVVEEATYVRHHKQKLVLIFSAMRHFAQTLREEGITVDYIRLDDPANTGSFTGEVQRAIARHRPSRITVTEPGEWRVLEMMKGWGAEILGDDRFFASPRLLRRMGKGPQAIAHGVLLPRHAPRLGPPDGR